MSSVPELTVVIPFYNRSDTVPLTLESVRRARHGLRIETLLIDDGSTPPATELFRGATPAPDRIIRQENQGLLFARLAGLRAATSDYVMFLDSDDLVGPEKFPAQLAAMRATNADVSYTDAANVELRTPYDAMIPTPDAVTEETDNSATFFIRIQGPPHSPVYRTAWLRHVVDTAFFPPSPLYNSVAEIWFYHNAAIHPARVVKVPGPHTINGHHAGARLTNHWEKIAVCALAVMEAFVRHCPVRADTYLVRRLVGERALCSFRRLPRGFFFAHQRRLIRVWRRCPPSDLRAVGEKNFVRLARVIGPFAAAWLLRRLRNGPYSGCRSIADDRLFHEWLAQLPPP